MTTFRQFLEAISPHNKEVEKNITIKTATLPSRMRIASAEFNVQGTPFACELRERPVLRSEDGPLLAHFRDLDPYARIHEFSFVNAETDSYRLHNSFGHAATEVYSHVVVAFRMLIEAMHEAGSTPVAIKFYGYDSSTDPLYDRLFRQFFSQDYARLSSQFIMRKDVLDDLTYENPEVQTLHRDALDAHRTSLDKARQTQRDKRQARRGTAGSPA